MAIARFAVLLAVCLSLPAHAIMSVEDNDCDWLSSTNSEYCFLSRSISTVDAKIQQTTLVLGEVEFLSPCRGVDPGSSYVRVTTTVKQAAAAKKVSIRVKNGQSVVWSARRPGGNALQYVEFDGSFANAQALAEALQSGKAIEVVFYTGLLSRVRGTISSKDFSQRFAEFNACRASTGKAR